MADYQHFVYMIRPARGLDFLENPTPEEEQAMSAHFAYLKAATEAGTVLMAGPCIAGADTFGLVVLRVESESAAQAFMDGDPSVQAGVQNAKLYPFRLSLWGKG